MRNQFCERWDSFFHARCSCRRSLSVAALIRVLYGILLFSNAWGLFIDFDEWFVYLLPVERAKMTVASPHVWSIWKWIPSAHHIWTLRLALISWMFHAVCFGLGLCWPYLHCFAIFWWHSQFHAHNGVLWNGEDVCFRMLSFFLLFFPLHFGTALSCFSSGRAVPFSWPMWPFRLLQIQMCLIYLSSGILKLSSPMWCSGNALFYVIHRQDFYGKWFNPPWIFGNMDLLRLLAWATMTLELIFPLLVWIRQARRHVLICMATFHLCLHISMNLNHFHMIMLVGGLCFLVQPDDDASKAKAL